MARLDLGTSREPLAYSLSVEGIHTYQQQLDEILTSPSTITRDITGGNFAGGRYYIAPDGRGAAFDANSAFQHFEVFTP